MSKSNRDRDRDGRGVNTLEHRGTPTAPVPVRENGGKNADGEERPIEGTEPVEGAPLAGGNVSGDGDAPVQHDAEIYVPPDVAEFMSEEERLFEVFHENTKLDQVSETQTGLMFARILGSPMLKTTLANSYGRNRGAPLIELPRPSPLKQPYSRVIEGRRSIRSFTGAPISLEEVSSMLHNTYGISGETTLPGGVIQRLRPVPSGGALYPLELYVIASAVEGLRADGVYHYAVQEHGLEDLRCEVPREELVATLVGMQPDGILASAATIIVAGVFVRMTYKYANRGYRYVLMEVGAACAQLNFTAAALGLGSCQVAGFYDDRVNGYIGVDGVNECSINLVVMGRPQVKEPNETDHVHRH